MRFLVSFVAFDITVKSLELGDSSTMSGICHEIVNTEGSPYKQCETIRDIEVAFEQLRNYAGSDDTVTWPMHKVKVLTVEPVESSWAA